jgi:Glycosyl transferase family 2
MRLGQQHCLGRLECGGIVTDHRLKPIGQDPTVTVVMTCRERHGLASAAIDSVLRNTSMPFRFLYADVCSPEWVRAQVAGHAKTGRLEIVRFDEPLWPSEVRRRLAGSIDSTYAVFIDDDVLVAPNWLESLVACAEETGAGIVGALYLWGEDANTDRIHMAGGELTEEREAGGIVLRESHRHINKAPGEVVLERAECGYVEFHCMLMRREVFRAPEIFDDRIVCVHEHIHASLIARAMGYKTFIEPAARVTYLVSAPYAVSDLPVFRRRWSSQACESSIRAFADRWGVIDDERSFGVRNYVARHIGLVDPIRPTLRDPETAQTALRASDVRYSLTGLVELARSKGYKDHDLRQIGNAHWSALLLSNGGYRPCGRPFIDHLIGTASILVHYGCETRLVVAALLHAAYTHAPRIGGEPRETVNSIAHVLGGRDSTIERMVRAYTVRSSRWRFLSGLENWPNVATMADVDTVLLSLANDAELHLSGEVRATGRTDADDQPAVAKAHEICTILGIPGLAEATTRESKGPRTPLLLPKNLTRGSFRIVGTKPVPMVNPAFFDAQRAEAKARAQEQAAE